MNIYFCGIGGVGLGPLAEIALDAGYSVAGSDRSESLTTQELSERGVTVSLDQTGQHLSDINNQTPIDWFVYTSALPPDHPELVLAQRLGIKTSKRDELLAHIIDDKHLKLIAVAGTHGKTTTTSILVWVFKQLGIPVSYSVGTTISFGPSGQFDPVSEYFIYECDEYDRNLLHFNPYIAIIPSLSYDHPDTYPTIADYNDAFRQFLSQSEGSILWQSEANTLGVDSPSAWILSGQDVADIKLAGEHIRRNASLVVKTMERLEISGDITGAINQFPGAGRRFEKLADNLYTDYAVHPKEIQATIDLARELSSDVTVVYQPHQNVRQHEIANGYTSEIFSGASELYWIPTYQTRENPDLAILTPADLTKNIQHTSLHIAELDDELWQHIEAARQRGSLVLCMGAGPIDGWVRNQLKTTVQ